MVLPAEFIHKIPSPLFHHAPQPNPAQFALRNCWQTQRRRRQSLPTVPPLMAETTLWISERRRVPMFSPTRIHCHRYPARDVGYQNKVPSRQVAQRERHLQRSEWSGKAKLATAWSGNPPHRRFALRPSRPSDRLQHVFRCHRLSRPQWQDDWMSIGTTVNRNMHVERRLECHRPQNVGGNTGIPMS